MKTKSQARIERKYAHTKKNSRKLIQKSKKACGKNPQRADFFPESILHVFLTKNRKVKKKKFDLKHRKKATFWKKITSANRTKMCGFLV